MNETPLSVVMTNDQPPALENSTPRVLTGAPKWETVARERMRIAIKKFAKPLADLVARARLVNPSRMSKSYDYSMKQFYVPNASASVSSKPHDSV